MLRTLALVSICLAVNPLVAQCPPGEFTRGDVNGDGAVDIFDFLPIFNTFFIGSSAPTTMAADANDNGVLDVGDASSLEFLLFVAGSPFLPEPFDCGGTTGLCCGPDPTPDVGLPPSTSDVTLAIGDVAAPPGTTAFVDVAATNAVPICGLFMRLEYDAAKITVTAVDPLYFVGGGTSFDQVAEPAVGVLYLGGVAQPSFAIEAGSDTPLFRIHFTVAASAMGMAEFAFVDETVPGGIDVELSTTAVTFAAAQLPTLLVPGTTDGTISIDGSTGDPEFVRGDCNADGSIDIGDAIALLDVLFLGAPSPACESACDVNDDGLTDIGDSISLLSNLFAAGSPPPPPSSCGLDPTADSLACDTFPCP